MAEFQEVMHQWNRMCRTFDKGERCTECPIPNVHMCWYIGDDWIKDEYYAEVENIVMSWAAEHPEPVYPTWWDWFAAGGLDPDDPIPAEIAEKLVVEPIGVNAKRRMKDVVCRGDGYGAE